MGPDKEEWQDLEQFDYVDTEYLERVRARYCPLIGSFLIDFSLLEHALDLAIAEFIFNDSDELGFIITERLSVGNKIELFYKMYARMASCVDTRHQIALKGIKEQLVSLNEFRNSVVHACWGSLSKYGLVRTRTVVDSQDGHVKFKRVRISPKTIRSKDAETERLVEELEAWCGQIGEAT